MLLSYSLPPPALVLTELSLPRDVPISPAMAFDYRDDISYEEYQALYGKPARGSRIGDVFGWSLALAWWGWMCAAAGTCMVFEKAREKR